MIRNGQDNKKKQAMLNIILLQSGKKLVNIYGVYSISCKYITFFKCFNVNFNLIG